MGQVAVKCLCCQCSLVHTQLSLIVNLTSHSSFCSTECGVQFLNCLPFFFSRASELGKKSQLQPFQHAPPFSSGNGKWLHGTKANEASHHLAGMEPTSYNHQKSKYNSQKGSISTGLQLPECTHL
jgi:hypothetical protein